MLATVPSFVGQQQLLRALALQVETQRRFHEIAARIAGPNCPLGPLSPESQKLERNFFSTLFLAVTELAIGPSPWLPLCAMVNQGMRAWVTACDNILDDEYKEIFPFTSAGRGERMRSVLTLLLADRVVVEFMLDQFDAELIRRVGRISLSALLASAIQESEEEVARPAPVLAPEQILDDIHRRKTGDLFVAPLALPLTLAPVAQARAEQARTALRHFGLGCQILDDIKDLPDDIATGRHNLLVSLLVHRLGKQSLVERPQGEQGDWAAWDRFPEAAGLAWRIAQERFKNSADALSALGLPIDDAGRQSLVRWICHLLRLPDLAGTADVKEAS